MAFDVEAFIRNASEDTRKLIGEERALIAVSGGVDSTTVAVLVARAVGEKLSCVFIDTGFMREREPEKVKKGLAKFGVELKVVEARERFFKALEGLSDAEEKRKAFRETFYRLFGEIVREEGCKVLIQGTIAPDWIETKGGIKSQHNVLAQIGIDTSSEYGFRIVEPLLYLYKDQVRKVGEALGLPPEFYQRQPFPGPGLLVRVVGEVKREKVDELRRALDIVENNFADVGSQQYFAGIFENANERHAGIEKLANEFLGEKDARALVLKEKSTGVKGDLRRYGKIAALKGEAKPPIAQLVKLQFDIISKNPDFTRVLYLVREREDGNGEYLVSMRAVSTRDFMTADVTEIDWKILEKTADEIMKKCARVRGVYYDVTPKPPATVEYE